MDLFLSIYNLHRDERFWPSPDTFDPERFTRPYTNPDVPGWAGFDPTKWEGKLYPNEVASDFAYLPFGGGARKCVGDEFAVLEATVTLAMVLRRFNFEFDPAKQEGMADMYSHPKGLEHPVGMKTGKSNKTSKAGWFTIDSIPHPNFHARRSNDSYAERPTHAGEEAPALRITD
jgi:hypothetical protein